MKMQKSEKRILPFAQSKFLMYIPINKDEASLIAKGKNSTFLGILGNLD